MATNNKYSSGYSGLDSYLKDAYTYSIKPAVTAASNLGSAAYDFMTSGSSSQGPHVNNPDGVVQTKTYPLGSTAGDNYLIPQPTNLGQGEVPGTSIFGPVTNPNPINAVATPYNGMDEQQNYENTYTGQNGNVNAFNPNLQINPAGTSSPDGMMTTPTLPLYPGEAIGIDGVPYRPSAGQNNNPSSYSYEPNQGGSSAGSSTPVADVLNTRQFSQRTPSGSVYAPDMSAYNDSSLFNYTGQGGVPEYTYGQGLPTDGAGYNIWGSPANIANPYFEGQFAKSAGPADAAINMPAIEMPAGVPAIGGGSGTTFTQGPSGVTPRPGSNGLTPQQAAQAMAQAGQDLTYQQTIDEMGIFGPNNPPPSTTFPSPGSSTPEGLTNTGAGGRAIVPWINSKTGETFYAPHTGFKANNGDWKVASTMDNQLQQGQIGAVTPPDYGGMEFASATNQINNSSDGEELARKNFLNSNNGYDLGRPGDPSYREFVSNPLDETVTNYNAENPTTQQKMDMLQARADQVYGNMTAEEKRDGLFIEPTYSVSKDTMKLGIPDIFSTNNENVSSTGNLINRESPERNIFKADEIDIPTPPFRPEGQEGVDYWQSTNGDFFSMEDDMGTQALGPVPNMMSSGPDGRSARGDSSRPLTEAELSPDTGELTSGDMGALSDSFAAIDAKYAGSTTEASAEAELNDIIGVIIDEFDGMNIQDMVSEVALTPDALPAEPSYRFADEGQDTGESTSSLMVGGGTPFDNPYVAPPLENVVNPSNVAEIMFGIDTAMPQNGVRSADNTMTMPTFREDVLPAPVYTPVPQPVARPRPVYNTPPSAPPSVLSRPTPTPVARPPASAYTWRPSYGGSGGYRF